MIKDKILVALDVAGESEAREIVAQLKNEVGGFKIGLQLFTSLGGKFVSELTKQQIKVFLDLKLHDIPNTVAKAAVEAVRLGVWMFDLHTVCGSETMLRTVEEVKEAALKENICAPKVIGVTVLTSATNATLQETGIVSTTDEQVLRLAKLAAKSGLDGVVASPLEIQIIRDGIEEQGFLVVTPGIRSVEKGKSSKIAEVNDQKRTLSPAEAVGAGADYLVIGRPITKAQNMSKAVAEIISEIDLLN